MPEHPFLFLDVDGVVNPYAGDRAAACLDDIVTEEARRWAASRTVATLLVEVDRRRWLERHHVDRLLCWARSKSG